MEYYLNFNYPGIGECFAIKKKDLIGKSYTPDKNAPDLLFGQFLCVGGDIAWIMDIFIDDEMIDECKKHDIF